MNNIHQFKKKAYLILSAFQL